MDASSTSVTTTETASANWTIPRTSDGLRPGQLIMFPIGILVIVFSSLALLSISRCRTVDKRVRILTQCVTITDMTLWCSMMVTVCVNNSRLRYIPVLCMANFCFSRTSVLVNLLVITVLALDRVLCLYFPFKYIDFVTKRRLVSLYLTIFVISMVLPMLSIPTKMDDCVTPYQAEGYGVIGITYLLCIIIVAVSYFGIFKNILKHVNQMRRMNMPARISGRKMYRSTLGFSLIILTFILCYSPAGIYTAIMFFNRTIYASTFRLRQIINMIYVCHSLINPFIYVWVFPECRLQMLKLLCPWNSEKITKIENDIKIISAPYLSSRPTLNPAP